MPRWVSKRHGALALALTLASALVSIGFAATAQAQCIKPGDPCDDGLYCTVGDLCDSMLTCVGTPRDCGDSNPCTIDSCDEMSMACVQRNAPPSTPCSDGQYCTVSDHCNGLGGCVGGTPRTCDDHLSCTEDSCNETADACRNVLVMDCLVDGVCVVDFASSPDNPCMICMSSIADRAFTPAPRGTPCGVDVCADGQRTPAPICDAAGACGATTTTPCATGVCGDATKCATCAEERDCALGQVCIAHECVAGPSDGGVVEDGGEPEDAGPTDAGETILVAHGGGCIACTVAPVSVDHRHRGALAFAALLLFASFARRGRSFTSPR